IPVREGQARGRAGVDAGREWLAARRCDCRRGRATARRAHRRPRDEASVKCLVTGAAGFIGSHLATRLAELGHETVGVDCFLDYYPRAVKERNLRSFRGWSDVRFLEEDLSSAELAPLFAGVDW